MHYFHHSWNAQVKVTLCDNALLFSLSHFPVPLPYTPHYSLPNKRSFTSKSPSQVYFWELNVTQSGKALL